MKLNYQNISDILKDLLDVGEMCMNLNNKRRQNAPEIIIFIREALDWVDSLDHTDMDEESEFAFIEFISEVLQNIVDKDKKTVDISLKLSVEIDGIYNDMLQESLKYEKAISRKVDVDKGKKIRERHKKKLIKLIQTMEFALKAGLHQLKRRRINVHKRG